MHASKSTAAAPDLTASLPTVICHSLGSGLTALLAHELAIDGFRLAIGPHTKTAWELGVDVILLERDPVDPQDLIDDVRRCCPGARMISVVTIGGVTIVHAFAGVPRASDLERLRILAAAVRRAARSAATTPATAAAETPCCRPDDSSSAPTGTGDELPPRGVV